MSTIRRKTYDITEDGNYIYLTYRRLHTMEIMTWNSLLYQIITSPGISFFYYDGRLRFQVQTCSPHVTCRIHDLSYACYHGYIKSFDTWITGMQEYHDMKGERTVDHCDGNPHNNTVYNLSIMDVEPNSSKGAIIDRFIWPVVLKTAYVDSEYRISITWNDAKGADVTMYLRAANAEDFVDCLNSLADISPDWYGPLRVEKRCPRWTLRDGECWTADIGQSIAAQNELAAMPRETFKEHHKGELIESLSIVGMTQAVLLIRRDGENTLAE